MASRSNETQKKRSTKSRERHQPHFVSVRVISWIVIAVSFAFLADELYARVGGGQSYGGKGGGGGDGDSGALIYILFQIFRLLVYLTIEYPAIGIPLDIIVGCGVIYYFVRRGRRSSEPAILRLDTHDSAPADVPRQFAQLRKFDPNFSEIVFTDFAYALYGKAHEARGRSANALDQFSPYLSEASRKSLIERNPFGVKEVKGTFIGAMMIQNVRGRQADYRHASLLVFQALCLTRSVQRKP